MDPSEAFWQATAEYLGDLYAAEPVMATRMGVHDLDDRLPNRSRYATDERLRQARAYLHRIDHLSLATMPPEPRLDTRLARAVTQLEISRIEHWREQERDPSAVLREVVDGLLPLLASAERGDDGAAAAGVARMRGVPSLLEQARACLTHPTIDACGAGLALAPRVAAMLVQGAAAAAAPPRDGALADELGSAAAAAARAVEEFAAWMRAEALPAASPDSPLGREVYDYRLHTCHLLEEGSDALLEAALADAAGALASLKDEAAGTRSGKTWRALLEEADALAPRPADLLAAYSREVERARSYVALRRLLDAPAAGTLAVLAAPAWAADRVSPIGYQAPGPFEERQAAQLWVRPEPEGATLADMAGHSRFRIPVRVVAEAYPGRHLQTLRANAVPSRVRAHFGRNPLIREGWPRYAEDLMAEAGYYPAPRVRMTILRGHMRQAARAATDLAFHTGLLSAREAARQLADRAAIAEADAAAEVRHIAVRPMEAAHAWLGRRALHELRAELERRQGARFDLRRFHDHVLDLGAVPPRLLRDSLLSP